MKGLSKHARHSLDLACAQADAEKQYADITSEGELEDTRLQDPSPAEENPEWRYQHY
jgi:hypothetical protein